MFHIIRPDLNIDFLKQSKPWVLASTIFALVSIVLLATKGLNYGIDFTGGALVQVKVPASMEIGSLRKVLDEGGVKDPNVVTIGEPQDHEFMIKVQAGAENLTKVAGLVETSLNKAVPGQFEIKKVDMVGPAAGESLRNSAFLSILYAMLCIVIYITFRFDMRYAPGVLRALAVDVIITLGFWSLLGFEFNLTVLAAMLTIAGYSCNDTIVIYDRIRDFTRSHPDWPLERAINKSINLNLGRTFLTVGSTLIVVFSMFFLGGPVLRDFSLPLIIGFSVSIP
jgi:preprotein translocase subunit SecF